MTIISHNWGLKKIHMKKKKSSKEVGIKGMSDEGFEKEMVELGEKLNHVKQLL